MTIEVHLKVETLADLATELHRVLGPLLAQQGVTLPEAPKRGRPRKDSVPAEPAAEQPANSSATVMSREEASAPEPEPEPEAEKPPTLEEMRALLARFQAAHPRQVAAVLDLMRQHGGASRLSDCPVETWPAIAAGAEQYLARSAAA